MILTNEQRDLLREFTEFQIATLSGASDDPVLGMQIGDALRALLPMYELAQLMVSMEQTYGETES